MAELKKAPMHFQAQAFPMFPMCADEERPVQSFVLESRSRRAAFGMLNPEKKAEEASAGGCTASAPVSVDGDYALAV
jgi:hypothetical protein